jgi:hypothetical protein
VITEGLDVGLDLGMYALLGVLAFSYLVAARLVGGHVAYTLAKHYPEQDGKPDGLDWSAGVVAGLGWPAVISFRVLAALVSGLVLLTGAVAPELGAEATYMKEQKRTQLLSQIKSQEEVAQIETKLGVGEVIEYEYHTFKDLN